MAPTPTVVFDFDGTLADTLQVGLDACNRVAADFGARQIAAAEVGDLMRLSTREAVRTLGLPLAQLPRIVRRVRDQMHARLPEVRLFGGMKEALARLHAAALPLGVLTSNSRVNVEECLARNGVLPWFDFVHSSTHVFGKDRALRRVLRGRRLSADQVVYVGDQDRDVEAARHCGIAVVAVSWGYQSTDHLTAQNPDLIAATPNELVDFLLSARKLRPR